MRKGNSIILYFLAGLLLMIVYCGNSPTAGNGSQTPNAICGIIYNPNGSRAVNATVFIITSDHNPKPIKNEIRTIVDTIITDDTGAFFLDSLPDGYYNIVGKGDSGVSYNDSVFIQGDTTNDNLSDTLRSSGTLSGVVRLQPGDDSRTVFILVFGTQTWITPIDSIGNFTLSLAEGTYHVRMLTTLDDYDPLDTNLTTLYGVNDTLADIIYLPFTGIPIPTGLTLTYDTLKQIVTLTWDKSDTTLVKGYNIYRKHSDSDFVKINPALISNNAYSDSSVIQDQSYEYKITAVDNGDNEGKKSKGVNVIVVSGFKLLDSILLKINSLDSYRFAFSKDSLIYVAYRKDAFVNVFSQAGDSLYSFGKGIFIQIYDIALDSRQNVYAVDPDKDMVRKFNKDGDSLLEWSVEYPSAMVIDSNDNIYISFDDEHGLAKFDTAGNLIKSIMFPAINKIRYLAIAVNGNILVGDAEELNVKEYTKDLDLVNTYEFIVRNERQFRIASTDAKENIYFIVEFVENSIVKYELHIFNSSHDFLAKLSPNLNVSDFTILNNTIYFLDPSNIVKKFSNRLGI